MAMSSSILRRMQSVPVSMVNGYVPKERRSAPIVVSVWLQHWPCWPIRMLSTVRLRRFSRSMRRPVWPVHSVWETKCWPVNIWSISTQKMKAKFLLVVQAVWTHWERSIILRNPHLPDWYGSVSICSDWRVVTPVTISKRAEAIQISCWTVSSLTVRRPLLCVWPISTAEICAMPSRERRQRSLVFRLSM